MNKRLIGKKKKINFQFSISFNIFFYFPQHSFNLFNYLFSRTFNYLYIYLYRNMWIYIFICTFIYLFMYYFVDLFMYLFIYLRIYLFIVFAGLVLHTFQ